MGERGVRRNVTPAVAGGDFNAASELVEDLGALDVSLAPFLCLIVDHFECPDITPSPRISSISLWMRASPVSSGWNDVATTFASHHHGVPVDRRQGLPDSLAHLLDPGCPDEDRPHGFVDPDDVDVGLEGGDLGSEGVAAHHRPAHRVVPGVALRSWPTPERSSGAGSEGGKASRNRIANRFDQSIAIGDLMVDALATRNDQRAEIPSRSSG